MLRTAAVLALVTLVGGAHASSHREAPFVTEHPKVDATDFYMFRSYESGRDSFVTLIANYHPLQDAYGGPNYFSMDPDALYEIHVENTGDAVEDLTFQFRFQNVLRDLTVPVNGVDVSVPLINIGPIVTGDESNLNVQEQYTVTLVTGDRRTGTSAAVTNAADNTTVFRKPVDYIGTKSLGDASTYEGYARSYLYSINVPGCGTAGRMFVGQRDDSFPVNLGVIFDLVNTDPATPTDPPIARNAGANVLDQKNVTTFALELPISCLTNSGANPKIGAWTTASLRQGRVLNPSPVFDSNPALIKPPAIEGGAWTQVSRLGMPLVNEVVIGLKDKDRFNASEPQADTQFLTYVTNPTLPVLLNALFGVTPPTTDPRQDLVEVFLTGLPGVNDTGSTAEMLRLDTAAAVVDAATQQDLGALAGDTAGFPNGRRPGDDVVDIALRVVMGALLPPAEAPSGSLTNTDGAAADASTFQSIFPYLNTPNPGAP